LSHRPKELSGGERQRVAIARSLANGPKLLLADEPTGNLDSCNAAQIIDLLLQIHQEQRMTMVLVTHDLALAGRTDRIVRMLDGQIITEPAMC
jgi:putative ABC transport system ATP-binding protein